MRIVKRLRKRAIRGCFVGGRFQLGDESARAHVELPPGVWPQDGDARAAGKNGEEHREASRDEHPRREVVLAERQAAKERGRE